MRDTASSRANYVGLGLGKGLGQIDANKDMM